MVGLVFLIAFFQLFSMIVCWSIFVFLFFVFMFLDSFSHQELILTFLLSFWLIIKLHHYYITKLHYSILFYTLFRYYLFSIVFIFHFLFSFLISYYF